jgi:hypothetical protein
MKQFTLQQINDIFNNRNYITRERFLYYFGLWYKDVSSKTIERWWEIYNDFPYWEDETSEAGAILEEILVKVQPILEVMMNPKELICNYKLNKRIQKKVYYKNSGSNEVLSVELDLNSQSDIIAFAELLKSKCEIIVSLDLVDVIHCSNIKGFKNKDFDVYDGDIFVTTDETYSRSHHDNIYVCKDGDYHRLLYTMGKGYFRDGKPDYDEEKKYSSHVLTGRKLAKRVGNIYIDYSYLIDKKPKKNI